MSIKQFSYEYEIIPKYMKFVLGDNRCNLDALYTQFPTVKFRKLWDNRSGFYLEAPSINVLDSVKRAISILEIKAQKITNDISTRKRTIKERNIRQSQYNAAERIRKTFETEESLKTNEPLEQEVVVTKDNLSETIKQKMNDKNPFALLESLDDNYLSE
jgi:hypothetical protein